MFLSLMVWLAVAGQKAVDPPTPAERLLKEFRAGAIEKMHRDMLEFTKSRRAFLEEMIEMFERNLKKPSRYTPEGASTARQRLEPLREQVEFMKKVQAELEQYEQQRKLNPGLVTDEEAIARLEKLFAEQGPREVAPPPREKK